eukprot:TRINITY_DN3158_c0_g1_i2.p1 TRINITY_DN3158_c0_g1~~TRINITY_DN3158_c0_g1_i2.p1  ORF type:complete len:197 (-),score=28.27 TRINITY_DN3158_c0_g1_i2:8-598(-)
MANKEHPPLLESAKHVERHANTVGEYIKSALYGGFDGVVSVFVSIAATSGTTSSVSVALILGLAKLFAGGLSMGVGDWLATDAEVDLARRERAREEWECDNFLQGEIEEMVHLYIKKGIDEKSARRLVEIMSRNRQGFVDIMMSEELGIPLDVLDKKPWAHGLVSWSVERSCTQRPTFAGPPAHNIATTNRPRAEL